MRIPIEDRLEAAIRTPLPMDALRKTVLEPAPESVVVKSPDQARSAGPIAASGGWSLIALIVLLSVAIIALVGVSSAVADGLRISLSRVNETNALYLAHAGIMDAIASYRSGTTGNNWFELNCFGNATGCDDNPPLNFGTDEVFLRDPSDPLGFPQRDFLLVDLSNETDNPAVRRRSATTATFDDWELRRVSSNKVLTLTGLEVRWTGAGASQHVTRVCLGADWNSGGSNCYTLPVPAVSGALINLTSIPHSTLNDNAWLSNNHVLFDFRIDQVSNLVVTLTVRFSDGPSCTATDIALPNAPTMADLPAIRQAQLTEQCQRTAVWAKTDNAQNWGLFTVRASGEVRAAPVTTGRRKLRAEYRAHATNASQRNQIISWTEE